LGWGVPKLTLGEPKAKPGRSDGYGFFPGNSFRRLRAGQVPDSRPSGNVRVVNRTIRSAEKAARCWLSVSRPFSPVTFFTFPVIRGVCRKKRKFFSIPGFIGFRLFNSLLFFRLYEFKRGKVM
jgi:hypothetical protein